MRAKTLFSGGAGLLCLALAIFLPRPAPAAWPTDPLVNLPLCTAAGNQQAPKIISDGAGGAIVTWADDRNGSNTDIYAQHVLASGAVDPAWPTDGRAVCSAANEQWYPTIVSNDTGGAIVTWEDFRSGTNRDIYAQRVQADGQLGGDVVSVPADASLGLAIDPVRPNPSARGQLVVHFTLATPAPALLELLDVAGRRMTAREVGSLGTGRHALVLGRGGDLPPGLYFLRLTLGARSVSAKAVVVH